MIETASPAAAEPSATSLLHANSFLRFVLVGAAGFLADASILVAAVHAFGANPLSARIASFSSAVLLTFELNRRWSFRGRGEGAYWRAFTKYLSVQGVGFVTNFVVYSGLYLTRTRPFDSPLLCLAIAAVIALMINYLGVSQLVFATKPRSEI